MKNEEAEEIIRRVQYWHYQFELPWGPTIATKPMHNARHLLRRQHFFAPLLERYGGSLTNKRVLDLGSCQGFWSFQAARSGAAYCLGIDSSQDFVTQAEALRVLYNINTCEFRRAHLEEDAWWDGLEPFNITLFLGLFYHLTDPIFVLRKAMRYTLETIIVDTQSVPRSEPVLEIVPRNLRELTTMNSNISSSIRVVPSRAALEELLRDGGFEVEFLTPHQELPAEYHTGSRITLMARRR